MKFIFVAEGPFYLGPDDRWYATTDYGIKYYISLLPEVTEFVMWGRLQRTEETVGNFPFPSQVGKCKVRFAGPWIKRKLRIQWPMLLVKSFLALKKEIASSDIVFMRMPTFFASLGYHFIRVDQKVILYLIGDIKEALPLMAPRVKWLAPIFTKYCRKIAKRADFASFMSQVLIDRYGKDCSNAIISNNCRYPRDVIVKERSAETNVPPRIVSLGRLSIEKGHHILFEAISILKEKMDIRLDIIGVGKIRQQLEQLADKLGISSNITWYGRVASGQPLFGALRRCDTFVLSSFIEGMPSTIPEAMSQGLPIVATDVGGVRDILLNGQAGLIVPPGDSKALAEALERSITDIDLRKHLIKQSLEQAEANCLENQAGKLVDGITALIRNKGEN